MEKMVTRAMFLAEEIEKSKVVGIRDWTELERRMLADFG